MWSRPDSNLLRPSCYQRLPMRTTCANVSNRCRSVQRQRVLCQQSETLLEQYIGSIQAAQVQGKGRGIITTTAVEAGEVLLVSKPLAILHGKPRKYLTPSQLFRSLRKADLDEDTLLWLCLLYDGEAYTANQLFSLEAPELQEVAGSDDAAAGVVLDEQRMKRVVNLNCFGEDYGDPAMLACRKEKLRSYIGIWPEFSLINHSCAPNACMMVLKDTMIVRAARAIAAGQEVTINYLGQLVASPLNVRGSQLRQVYGFECDCQRCVAERNLGTVQPLITALYTQYVADGKSSILTALDEGDDDVIRRMAVGMAEGLTNLNKALDTTGVPAASKLVIQAAAYQVYELLSMCQQHLAGQSDPSNLAARLAIMETFAVGTYDFAFWTHRLVQLLETKKADPRRIARAKVQMAKAHISRYGKLTAESFAQLAAAHDNNELISSAFL